MPVRRPRQPFHASTKGPRDRLYSHRAHSQTKPENPKTSKVYRTIKPRVSIFSNGIWKTGNGVSESENSALGDPKGASGNSSKIVQGCKQSYQENARRCSNTYQRHPSRLDQAPSPDRQHSPPSEERGAERHPHPTSEAKPETQQTLRRRPASRRPPPSESDVRPDGQAQRWPRRRASTKTKERQTPPPKPRREEREGRKFRDKPRQKRRDENARGLTSD